MQLITTQQYWYPQNDRNLASWKGHRGLGHSSARQGVQLGSCKELMSMVPAQLPLIMGGSILGPKIHPWGIKS